MRCLICVVVTIVITLVIVSVSWAQVPRHRRPDVRRSLPPPKQIVVDPVVAAQHRALFGHEPRWEETPVNKLLNGRNPVVWTYTGPGRPPVKYYRWGL